MEWPGWFRPYTVKETVNGSSATYALREDYWDTSKTFDCTEITVRYYSDANTMWVDYQNGVIDAVLGLDDTQVTALQNGTVEGTLMMADTNAVPALVMNENNEYLADIEVRRRSAMLLTGQTLAISRLVPSRPLHTATGRPPPRPIRSTRAIHMIQIWPDRFWPMPGMRTERSSWSMWPSTRPPRYESWRPSWDTWKKSGSL